MFECDCKDKSKSKSKSTYYSNGSMMMTTAYYPPVYDRDGNNINPDRNKSTSRYICNMCGAKSVQTVENGNTTWERED